MSFSTRVLTGLISGLALGILLGDLVAPLKVFADGFIKLLQMTVLPYVTVSIISSLVSNSCPHWIHRIQSDSTNGSSSRIPIPPQSGHRAK